ncbi:MAG: CoA transferase subunit A [Desulfitobacterium sp.]
MKTIIGVKYCGHCNPLVEGPEIVENLEKLGPNLEFVSWQEPKKDILLMINACTSDCATRPHFDGPVINVSGSSVEWIEYSRTGLPSQIIRMIEEKEAESLSNVELNNKKKADKRMTLTDAIKTYVQDGSMISFSGMGGAQCVAHTYEIIRQGIKNLTLVGDSPCESGDMLIGAGAVNKAELAWCSYAVAGLGYNFRRAIEEKVPHAIELTEYSNFTIGLRFLAGAINVPYIPTKSLMGSDLLKYNEKIKVEEDPYTGEKVALIPAVHPDVAIVHVSRADKRGNAQTFGFSSNAENLARAAKYTIITCEEIVSKDEITRHPNLTVVPEYAVDAVVEVPYACHPWNFPYAYAYDMPFHTEQLAAFKTREGFEKWLEEYCFAPGSWEGYLEKVGYGRLDKLRRLENRFTKANY